MRYSVDHRIYYTCSAGRLHPFAPDDRCFTVSLVGRHVTVIFNGEKVIDNMEIPGITTGALNSREAEPGPLLLQGDHGHIEFRHIQITRPKGEQAIFY